MSVVDLPDSLPAIQVYELTDHAGLERIQRGDNIAARRMGDWERADKGRTGSKGEVSFIMEGKRHLCTFTQHDPGLSLFTVLFQIRSFQQAAAFQIHHAAPLASGQVADQHTFSHVPGHTDDRMGRFRARIVQQEETGIDGWRRWHEDCRKDARPRQDAWVTGICIAGLIHPAERIIAGKDCRKGAAVTNLPGHVLMVVQADFDPFAGDRAIYSEGLMVENQAAPGVPPQPAVYLFQGFFRNILKEAFLLKHPGLDPRSDIIPAVPVLRDDLADFVFLHLPAPAFCVRPVKTAQSTGMDAVKRESVHDSPPSRGGADHPIRSPPTLMPRMAFPMICSPTFSAMVS